MEILADKHQFLASQILIWKIEAIKNILTVFNNEIEVTKKEEIHTEKQFNRIKKVPLKNDFKKN